MDSLISHLIKNPTYVNILIFTTLIIFGIILIVIAVHLVDEEKKDENKTKKFYIKAILFFTGLFIYIMFPIGLVWYKVNQYEQITTNKEYTLTKKGKILTITSENQFLSSTDLEIIYDDNNEMQVKVDNKLFTIDKNFETINEK